MTVKDPQTWTWRAGPQAGERMPGGSHWQCGAGWAGEMRGGGFRLGQEISSPDQTEGEPGQQRGILRVLRSQEVCPG